MEEKIENIQTAIKEYLQSIEWDEMDKEARIERFWTDVGSEYFEDESIEDYRAEKWSPFLDESYERFLRENPDLID